MYAHTCEFVYPQRSEEGIQSPEFGVTACCKLPEMDTLKEQYSLSHLSSPLFDFFFLVMRFSS